jgi:type II secretory pathway pseudopilin PulG
MQRRAGPAVTGPASLNRASAQALRGEQGITLVELMVASTMAIILLAATTSLIVSTLNDQPQVSQKAANIQTARVALYRITRDVRNGQSVESATASSVSFKTYVRDATCGGSTMLASTVSATLCEVTYACSGGAVTRIEAAPGVFTGAADPVIRNLSGCNVFSFSPSAVSPTFIGVALSLPNPRGSGSLTISDGSTLRNGTLTN